MSVKKDVYEILLKLDGIPSKARVGLFLKGMGNIRWIPLWIHFIGKYKVGSIRVTSNGVRSKV